MYKDNTSFLRDDNVDNQDDKNKSEIMEVGDIKTENLDN